MISHTSISIAAYSVKGKVIDEITGKGIPNMAITAKSSEKIDIIEHYCPVKFDCTSVTY
jgi:hypothetical protein